MSNIPRRRALGDDLEDLYGQGGFDLTPYRGAIVVSRSGWAADVTGRGGVVTQVPDGVLAGLEAGRFGTSPPYLYELPPLWLMVSDGIDITTDAINELYLDSGILESDQNQIDQVKAVGTAASNVVGSIPTIVKWGAIAVIGLVALNVLQATGAHE